MLRRRLFGEKGQSFPYFTGSFVCPNGANFNNYYSGSANLGVHATFRLADNTSFKTIARNINAAGTNGWDLHFTSSDYYHILEFQELYNGKSANFQFWTWTFEPNTWYTLDFYVNSTAAYASINGSAHVSATVSARQRSSFSDARSVVFGNSLMSFRGDLGLWGTSYNASSKLNWVGWNFDDATVGMPLDLTSGGYALQSETKVKRGWE